MYVGLALACVLLVPKRSRRYGLAFAVTALSVLFLPTIKHVIYSLVPYWIGAVCMGALFFGALFSIATLILGKDIVHDIIASYIVATINSTFRLALRSLFVSGAFVTRQAVHFAKKLIGSRVLK